MKISWIGILGGLVLSVSLGTLVGQQNFDNVVVQPKQVSGHVWVLFGAGGNVGVSVGKDGMLIVDNQFAPMAEKIQAALKEIGSGDLKFVLNTHWHGDHTGGNSVFGGLAPIVAHQNVRKRLEAGRGGQSTSQAALPVITYEEGLSLFFNGEEVRVRHVPPGHTDGDSMVFFTGANVLHMGDQFFNGRFPFIDPSSGGSVKGYLENVKWALSQVNEETRIIPGHGELGTRKDLEAFRDMLEASLSLVRTRMAQGKTLEQIQAEGVPEVYQSWGTGFINVSRWLQIVYNGLSEQ